jgi:hypothetical protein
VSSRREGSVSTFQIPNPNGQAGGRSGREAAAAAILLKRVRPCARAGFAEGSRQVGSGQDGDAWSKPCNYYSIMIVMKIPFCSAGGPRANSYSERNTKKIKLAPFLQNEVVSPFRINKSFRRKAKNDQKNPILQNEDVKPFRINSLYEKCGT